MQLARQLGARRFEAQGLEMQARILLDTGRRAEAAEMLRETLAICREAGTQFCGPKVTSALSRIVGVLLLARRPVVWLQNRLLKGGGSKNLKVSSAFLCARIFVIDHLALL